MLEYNDIGLWTLDFKEVNEKTLEKIRAELASVLIGQQFGKIFSLSRFQMAIDFRLHDSQYLYINFEPSAPRIYLIKRRLRDLEKQSKNQTPFVLFLRKRLANAVLELSQNRDKARAMGRSARQHVVEHFDRQKQAAEFTSLLEQLARAR